jgi:nitrate reductase gamma subunit
MDLHTIQMIHYGALAVMVLVYVVRLAWFFRFPAGKERQPPTGVGSAVNRRSLWYSWFVVASPTGMESYRKHWFLYLQFVVFHLGVAAAIAMSFVIADFDSLMESSAVVLAFQVLIWGACGVGVLRIIRRVGSRYLRAISSPDDYFSLILLTVWFGMAASAAPYGPPAKQAAGESILIGYYAVQTFFLLYVPFSKISHYLYYPFTRYYLGKTLGRRGVYPMTRRPSQGAAR